MSSSFAPSTDWQHQTPGTHVWCAAKSLPIKWILHSRLQWSIIVKMKDGCTLEHSHSVLTILHYRRQAQAEVTIRWTSSCLLALHLALQSATYVCKVAGAMTSTATHRPLSAKSCYYRIHGVVRWADHRRGITSNITFALRHKSWRKHMWGGWYTESCWSTGTRHSITRH